MAVDPALKLSDFVLNHTCLKFFGNGGFEVFVYADQYCFSAN